MKIPFFVTRALAVMIFAVAGALSPAQAATVIDQDNATNRGAFCSIWAYQLCGQSFRQTSDTLAGAGFNLSAAYNNAGGPITFSVYTTYGQTPGGLVATGTTTAAATSGWVDVFWDAVSVTAGQTYYLVASSQQFNVLSYANNNSYAAGNAIYGGSTTNYRTYDLSFRTFANVPSAVPLPASLTLLLGAIGIAAAMRRRRQPV